MGGVLWLLGRGCDGQWLSGSANRCLRQKRMERVEHGIYVCETCDVAFNADLNGAEIRLSINNGERNSESVPALGGRRSTSWVT